MEEIPTRLIQDILASRFFEFKCGRQDISLKKFLDELEKYILFTGLNLSHWNQRKISQILMINEKTMSLKIKKYQLKSRSNSY